VTHAHIYGSAEADGRPIPDSRASAAPPRRRYPVPYIFRSPPLRSRRAGGLVKKQLGAAQARRSVHILRQPGGASDRGVEISAIEGFQSRPRVPRPASRWARSADTRSAIRGLRDRHLFGARRRSRSRSSSAWVSAAQFVSFVWAGGPTSRRGGFAVAEGTRHAVRRRGHGLPVLTRSARCTRSRAAGAEEMASTVFYNRRCSLRAPRRAIPQRAEGQADARYGRGHKKGFEKISNFTSVLVRRKITRRSRSAAGADLAVKGGSSKVTDWLRRIRTSSKHIRKAPRSSWSSRTGGATTPALPWQAADEVGA